MQQAMALTRDAIRALDQQAIEEIGIPGVVLMENAGVGIANHLLANHLISNVLVCCGKGNNGGDGFVVARHLDNHDIPTHILLFANLDELTHDAKVNYQIALNSRIPITIVDHRNRAAAMQRIANANYIIDALFGTGLQGNIKPPFDSIIHAINTSHAAIISIDIPSGLDCDTGQPLVIAVKATKTMSFTCLKQGFLYPQAALYIGEVQVIDIGIPKVLLRALG